MNDTNSSTRFTSSADLPITAHSINSSTRFTSSADHTALALLITTHSINLILGLPVNSYVLWLILSGAGGTIASEFFYLNLITSVILSSLAAAFHAWLFTHNFVFQRVSYFTFVAFFALSLPSFQCCICVERYVAVVRPLVFRRYGRLRYKAACCCAVWLAVLALSALVFWSQAVACCVFLGFCAACVSVVCFCCLSVLRALKRPGPGEGQRDRRQPGPTEGQRDGRQPGPGEVQRDGGEGNDLKRRAFRIIVVSLVVMSVTIVSYVPNVLSQLLNGSMPAPTYITYAIALLLAFVHPLLYMHKAGRLPRCFQIPSKSPILSETRI